MEFIPALMQHSVSCPRHLQHVEALPPFFLYSNKKATDNILSVAFSNLLNLSHFNIHAFFSCVVMLILILRFRFVRNAVEFLLFLLFLLVFFHVITPRIVCVEMGGDMYR